MQLENGSECNLSKRFLNQCIRPIQYIIIVIILMSNREISNQTTVHCTVHQCFRPEIHFKQKLTITTLIIIIPRE